MNEVTLSRALHSLSTKHPQRSPPDHHAMRSTRNNLPFSLRTRPGRPHFPSEARCPFELSRQEVILSYPRQLASVMSAGDLTHPPQGNAILRRRPLPSSSFR